MKQMACFFKEIHLNAISSLFSISPLFLRAMIDFFFFFKVKSDLGQSHFKRVKKKCLLKEEMLESRGEMTSYLKYVTP